MQETLLFIDISSHVDPTKEAAGNTVDASQIVGAARVTETPGAAQIAKETTGNALGASQTVITANEAETPGAAPVVKEAVKKRSRSISDCKNS